MTVSSENNRISYAGDGTANALSFPYPLLDEEDLLVIETVIATGAETEKALTTDYTVSIAGDGASATVTPVAVRPATVTWSLINDPPATQGTEFVDNDLLPASSIEDGLDKLTLIMQRVKSLVTRSLRQPDGDTTDIGELPAKVERASKYLAFDADGDPIATDGTTEANPVSTFMATVLDDANAATARSTLGLGTLAEENKTAVPAMTYAGAQSYADNILARPVIKDYGEAVNAIGSVGGGTQDIDLELGNVVTATVDTSETTFTFSNPPASGTAGSFTLVLTNGGSQTVNWPASVDWHGGTAPTLTSSGVDILTFVTVDGGTTWYGVVSGLGMA